MEDVGEGRSRGSDISVEFDDYAGDAFLRRWSSTRSRWGTTRFARRLRLAHLRDDAGPRRHDVLGRLRHAALAVGGAILSAGPIDQIETTSNLQCQAHQRGHPAKTFYYQFEPVGNCYTALAVQSSGQVFYALGVDFTPVSSQRSGAGTIADPRIVGPITVLPGGALSLVNSQVSRGVVVDNPAFLNICGTDISGPSPATALSVSNAAVPIRIGDPANGCAGNRFAGPVTHTNNLAATFGANSVAGTATINNGAAGAGNTVIKANNATTKTGQCAGL